MIHVRFEILKHTDGDATEPVGQFELRSEQALLEISPDILRGHLQAFDPTADYGFNAHLTCTDALLAVRGFSYFTLAAFANARPRLASLKVIGASRFFRLNNLEISRLDSEQSNALVADCDVGEFNVGIETTFNRDAAGAGLGGAEQGPAGVDTDLRGTTVERVRIFTNHRRVNVQRSRLGCFEVERGCANSGTMHVWEESDIGYFVASGRIDVLRLENCRLQTVAFRENSRVRALQTTACVVEHAHGCRESTFEVPTMDTWQLVLKASQADRDVEAHAAAAYQYARLHGARHATRLAKAGDKMLDYSCGYGFRPARTAVLAAAVWLIWGLAYWVLTMTTTHGLGGGQNGWVSELGRSLYFSVIALTTVGFGDVTPKGWSAMLLSGAEGAIGIVLFALLVFSLTKRYSSY